MVLDRVEVSFSQLKTPLMQAFLRSQSGSMPAEILTLLEPQHFIGVVTRNERDEILAELWADGLPAWLRDAAMAAQPRLIGDLLVRGDETFVRVVMPIRTANSPSAMAEAYYRLAPETVHAINAETRGAALISGIAVGATAMLLYPLLLALTNQSLRLSRDLLESNLDLMRSLGSAIALRDSETDEHNYRVALYALRLAETAKMSHGIIADIMMGALLHDIGKIGIPDAVLLKPGPLTPEERGVVERHPQLGEQIIKQSAWLKRALPVVLHHHERYDGSGYPHRLSDTSIPQAARLFAIVDVFDALTTARPYKSPMSLEGALAVMEVDMAGQFDPELFAIFKRHARPLFKEIGEASDDARRVALVTAMRHYFALNAAAAPSSKG